MSTSILKFMNIRYDIRKIIAQNMRFFMERDNAPYRNANALAVAAKVAPNTVRNMLDPKKRTVTTGKPDGYPTLDKLEMIASALSCQVWELLHPDIERSIREREMYAKIQQDFASLPSAQARPVKA